MSYDIGYTRHDTLRFATAEPNYALYLITAPAAAEVAKEFRQLIGPSYIPPKWAFGLAQSRFGYKTEADIREVAAQYKANGLPLDMICMDIDYMQSYADFTIDKARFPDLGKLAADLKAEGIRLVPIIDAGIRCDDNDPVCREGLEKGYFRRHALCGGGLARQGLLHRLSPSRGSGVVRQAVQGAHRPRHRGLLERYERACPLLLP